MPKDLSLSLTRTLLSAESTSQNKPCSRPGLQTPPVVANVTLFLLSRLLGILDRIGNKAKAATVHIGKVGRSTVLELVTERILKGRFHGPHLIVLEARSRVATSTTATLEIIVIGWAKVAAILAAVENKRKQEKKIISSMRSASYPLRPVLSMVVSIGALGSDSLALTHPRCSWSTRAKMSVVVSMVSSSGGQKLQQYWQLPNERRQKTYLCEGNVV